MKKVTLLLVALQLSFLCSAQAHLGSTEAEIKALHPDNTWTVDFANDGTKYISSEMALGTFVYYFDEETGVSEYCIQLPSSMTNLNTQVQIYNEKYVITSTTSWTAYLEGGAIMYIRLYYDNAYQLYAFQYLSVPFTD